MPANDVVSVRNGQALIVTFNRPDAKNALTLDLANQAFTILKNATTDRSVRAVLINGAGHNFMAGVDMSQYVGDLSTALERTNQIVAPYHSAIRELQAMDKPVLACVEGEVSGCGLSFMLACDLVMAGHSAKFNCQFIDRALTPDGACTYFLPRKVGSGRAAEILMLNREFGIDEAKQWGLVNFVVDDDALQEESMQLVMQMAEGPTKAYGGIKKLLLRSFDQDLNAHLGLEHNYYGQTVRSFDFREYLLASASSRPAKFTGT